jgi:lipopolysaccharide transport system permease protein
MQEAQISDQIAKENEAEQWDLEIKPKAKLLHFNFAEIWRYRELMLLFVKRDFIAHYKQTILGPLWHVIQPILTTVTFLLLFTRVARLPTDGIPPTLFYMSGITFWNYFSVCLTGTSNTFVANANIFGKVYFPRLIMPLAVVVSNLVRFGIQFLLLLIVIVYYAFQHYPIHITTYWLLIPALLALIAGIALGLGIIISALTTRYRDFTMLLGIGVQLMMYATPIAYPLSHLDKLGFAEIIKINPVTPLAEAFRFILFGKGMFSALDILYSVCFMLVSLTIGLIFFNRIEKSFVDTV